MLIFGRFSILWIKVRSSFDLEFSLSSFMSSFRDSYLEKSMGFLSHF
jgi:hypothetical protein